MAQCFQLKTNNGLQYYGCPEKKLFPIHSVPEKIKDRLKNETHHYCDIFTNKILATLPEKVYINNNEYLVNKNKRLLIVSYDGKLNLWQNAPTIQCSEYLISGTPIMNSAGEIVSLITGSQNGYYAVSSFDGASGRFATNRKWQTVDVQNALIYANQSFQSREALWKYLERKQFGNNIDLQAVVVKNKIPRIILMDLCSGLEISHTYIRGEFDVEVCENYK